MKHNFNLKTKRLILRSLNQNDAEDCFEYLKDPEVTEYVIFNAYSNIDDVKEWLSSIENDLTPLKFSFAFQRQSDSKVIGNGDIWLNQDNMRWEFGYIFRQDCWNQGYATEALGAMLSFVNTTFKAKRFFSNCAISNGASARVMTKCGLHFVRYGTFCKIDGSHKEKSLEFEGDF